jgi:hypothetical protein
VRARAFGFGTLPLPGVKNKTEKIFSQTKLHFKPQPDLKTCHLKNNLRKRGCQTANITTILLGSLPPHYTLSVDM